MKRKKIVELADELWPYFKFLVVDVILISLTVLAIKFIIWVLIKAFGDGSGMLIKWIEIVSQIGIAIMFLIHTAKSLYDLGRKTWKDVKKKKG